MNVKHLAVEGYDYLKTNKFITSAKYGELFNCTDRTARMDLRRMCKLGIVEKRKVGDIKYNTFLVILSGNFRQLWLNDHCYFI